MPPFVTILHFLHYSFSLFILFLSPLICHYRSWATDDLSSNIALHHVGDIKSAYSPLPEAPNVGAAECCQSKSPNYFTYDFANCWKNTGVTPVQITPNDVWWVSGSWKCTLRQSAHVRNTQQPGWVLSQQTLRENTSAAITTEQTPERESDGFTASITRFIAGCNQTHLASEFMCFSVPPAGMWAFCIMKPCRLVQACWAGQHEPHRITSCSG